ncbi:hypothetical protein FCV61_15335 [Vibrio sp. F12]|nr:hypothetical protein FCV56_23670 [Vibrio sp. F12]TKE96696.1 hypothetical protein FCV61_15335 [Vibrio sp. F12]
MKKRRRLFSFSILISSKPIYQHLAFAFAFAFAPRIRISSPVSRICSYLCSLLFESRLLVSRICFSIALSDLPSYIQQYSYDIGLTWIAVE